MAWRFKGVCSRQNPICILLKILTNLFRRRLRLRRLRAVGRRRCGSGACGRRRSGRGCHRLRLRAGIDPAGVYVIPQAVRHLVIDLGCKAGQAAERCLNVSAGAAKPVIEIKVTKGSIEIVDPDKLHHTAAQPDAFRVSGRSVDRLRRFGELVDLVLAILGRLGQNQSAGPVMPGKWVPNAAETST